MTLYDFITGPVLGLGLAKTGSDEVSVRERYYNIALDLDRSNQAAKALLFSNWEINEKLTGINWDDGDDSQFESELVLLIFGRQID
jgi:hypothetical protein